MEQDAPEEVVTEIWPVSWTSTMWAVSTGEVFYDCFEGDSEEMIGAAQIEARARELRKAKNFSGMCEDLLRQFCPRGAGKPYRNAHLKEDARVTAGAYAHGGFYGVVGITYKYPETIRYLNAFLKSNGFKGSRTALSVGWNGATSLHRDPHNARDRDNCTMTLGKFQGGRLWVEDSLQPVLHGKIAAPRGRDARRDERDLLTSFGFPVGKPEMKGCADMAPADREAAVRPKRSIRKKLWKKALQASAMLTLSMSTASSYFGEFFSKPLEDGPAILEIGGMTMTSRVADWGRDVVEPIEHVMFLEKGGVELVTNLTNSLGPQVLWLHTADTNFNFVDKARSVLHQQLRRGGVAVLEGDLQDVSWDADSFKEEFSSYEVTFKQGELGKEITLRPAGEVEQSTVDQEAFAQDVVPPDAGVPASDPRGASAISFDSEVPQHIGVIGAALARLHQNLGHPENRDLTRHLRYAGADQAVLKASKSSRCHTCARRKRISTRWSVWIWRMCLIANVYDMSYYQSSTTPPPSIW